jgi:hypothetical protein
MLFVVRIASSVASSRSVTSNIYSLLSKLIGVEYTFFYNFNIFMSLTGSSLGLYIDILS